MNFLERFEHEAAAKAKAEGEQNILQKLTLLVEQGKSPQDIVQLLGANLDEKG